MVGSSGNRPLLPQEFGETGYGRAVVGPVWSMDPYDMRRIAAEGRRRAANHPDSSTRIRTGDAEPGECTGVAAELAIAYELQLDASPIFEDRGRWGGDGGVDFTVRGSVGVRAWLRPGAAAKLQVKSTDHRCGCLFFPPDQPDFTHDVVAMGIVSLRLQDVEGRAYDVRIAGWINRTLWSRRASYRDFGRGVGQQLSVTQEELEPIESLVAPERTL